MSVPPSNAAKLPLPQWAYVPGETAEAEADHDTLWQAMALVPSRFQDFVPASGAALRDCAQRCRIFLGSAGNPGGGLGGGAAGRTRADSAAGLHPDRQRQSQASDAKAASGGAFFWRGAERTRYAWTQCDDGRRRVRRCFSDGGAGGPPEGQTGATDASQGGLGRIRQNRPSMKQNACYHLDKATHKT